MALQKCPRCELNYILDGGSLCSVCREEVHGKDASKHEEDGLLCSVCGDEPPVPGEDMCASCLAEFRAATMATPRGESDEDDETVDVSDFEPEHVSEMDEMETTEDEMGDRPGEALDTEEDALLEELMQAQ